MTAILGISAFYHDSAAAIILDGKIVAAAQEERFSRIKHDSSFPSSSIRFVITKSGISLNELSYIVFYEKPLLKFERLLETYHAFAPQGISSFLSAIPVWIKERLFQKKLITNELQKLGIIKVKILFTEHHLSHAASAFFPSPFKEAAILTIDGVGEWATTTISKGSGNKIEILKEIQFPHSLGLLYSAFTYFLGFKVNSGEYKVMGLAPYGDPNNEQTRRFEVLIKNNLVDIKADGSIILNMQYFKYATGLKMIDRQKWEKLFDLKFREPESEINSSHANLALAVQHITEEIIIKLAKHAKEISGCNNLTLAGGVALNCVSNGKLLKTGIFKNIWIQPASGDAGGSLGAALTAWYIYKNNTRFENPDDSMSGAFLGPDYENESIMEMIRAFNAVYVYFDNFDDLCKITCNSINKGNVVGWFQGRMEFGPRALGNRSILGDARNPEMQKKLNLKIKYREGFRPFAPVVLEEDLELFFELKKSSPYMLLVDNVISSRRIKSPEIDSNNLLEKLYSKRSDLPAVTHLDYSARIQTVNETINPSFYKLLKYFKQLTGQGILVNTSFNVRGEPIVCSPVDAYRCFMSTEMDYLVVGNYFFSKNDQPSRTNFMKGAKSND